jgi:hypothetical protein
MDGSAEGNSLLDRYGIWLTFSCLELPEDSSRFAASCSQQKKALVSKSLASFGATGNA